MELLVLPELVKHTRSVDIDLKEFLFFRNLKANLELADGVVLGRRPSMA